MKTLFRFFVMPTNVEKVLDNIELMFYTIKKNKRSVKRNILYHRLFLGSYCKQRIRHNYKLDNIGMGQDTRKGDAFR
jgi:hypothetical protein